MGVRPGPRARKAWRVPVLLPHAAAARPWPICLNLSRLHPQLRHGAGIGPARGDRCEDCRDGVEPLSPGCGGRRGGSGRVASRPRGSAQGPGTWSDWAAGRQLVFSLLSASPRVAGSSSGRRWQRRVGSGLGAVPWPGGRGGRRFIHGVERERKLRLVSHAPI